VDSMPHLSPDGKKIVYSSIPVAGIIRRAYIWTFHFETGEQVQLTTEPADDFDPKWSSDGGMIAFASNRGGILTYI